MAFSYGNYATPGAQQPFVGNGNVYNGNTPTDQNSFSSDQIQGWFAKNPNATPQQIADTAAQYHMTPGGVAQAISIGTGANYDPGAVRNWLGANGGQTSGGGAGVDGVITGSNGNSPGYIGGGSSNLGFGSGNSGGGYGGGQGSMQSSSQGSMGGGKNPYLADMGKNMIDQMQENYTRNQAPLARSGAMAAGGFGGSRQGVVEANGLNDLNRSIGQNLTNLYGTDWTNAQNRGLQQQSINNSYDLGGRSLNNQYDLGLRSSDLGFANLDANIANSNFSNQMNAANFGLNATNAMNRQNGEAIQAGTNIHNAPMTYQQYFANQANTAGGQGGSSTGTQTNASNPYAGMVGGAMTGYDLYRQYQNNQPQVGNSDRSVIYGNTGYGT